MKFARNLNERFKRLWAASKALAFGQGGVNVFHQVTGLSASTIISRKDFFQKAESYWLFYNLERPNFSKGKKTPLLVAQEDREFA